LPIAPLIAPLIAALIAPLIAALIAPLIAALIAPLLLLRPYFFTLVSSRLLLYGFLNRLPGARPCALP
jgi:hypothetical protein